MNQAKISKQTSLYPGLLYLSRLLSLHCNTAQTETARVLLHDCLISESQDSHPHVPPINLF